MRDPDNKLLQQGWSPEFLSTANVESVQTEYEVLHLMRQCASHFRFSHFLVSRFPTNEQQRFAERLLVSNWPADLVRKYDAMALFHISRLAIERSSGNSYYDQTALRAITEANPFPPLPAEFPGQTLRVHLGFNFSAERG